MTQYNMSSVKLSNSQVSKLKSGIKNEPEVTLNLSSNIIGNFNDWDKFSNKILLTDTQISKIRKDLANCSLANIKFSKTQFSKTVKLGGVLSNIRIFGNMLLSVAK